MSVCTSAISVYTRKRSEVQKKFRMPPGKHPVHSVSGRHLTTADGMQPALSGGHPKPFFSVLYRSFTDLHRHFTEIAEVR